MNPVGNLIQLFYSKLSYWCLTLRCFPHIVNLACKAVLAAITHLEYVKETADNYIPTGPGPSSFTDAISHDPIATLWSLIMAVHTLLHI